MNRFIHSMACCLLIPACAAGLPGRSTFNGECRDDPRTESLNAKNVPAQFSDLVPLAELWGTPDPERRDEMEQTATVVEIDFLHETLHERRHAIKKWLRSALTSGRGSAEACAFKRMLDLYEDLLDMRLRRTLR